MNNSIKFLVVDDDRLTLMLLERMIRSLDHEVYKASSRAECFALLANVKPDIIILDILLNNENGFDICGEIKAVPEFSDVLVVLYSGKSFLLEDRNRGKVAGADGYISKSIDEEAFKFNFEIYIKLSVSEKERKAANDRLLELNSILQTKNEINSILAGSLEYEKLPAKLVCSLTANAVFYSAIIILKIPEGMERRFCAVEGESRNFSNEDFNNCRFLSCFNGSESRKPGFILNEKVKSSEKCFFVKNNSEVGIFCSTIGFRDEHYGKIVVSVNDSLVSIKDMERILIDLAKSIGRAIHRINTENMENSFRESLIKIPEPVAIISKDYRYLAVNKFYASYHKRDVSDFLHLKVSDVIEQDVYNSFFKPQIDKCLSGEVLHFNRIVENPKNKMIDLAMSLYPLKNINDEIIGAIILGIDRSELNESREKFRLIAENSIDIIWQMDLELKFIYVSPSISEIFGYTPEEWTGTFLFQHATKKEFIKMTAETAKAVKTYKNFKSTTFEAVMLHKDGSEVPVEISGKLILNDMGLPSGFQGSTRPIFERKENELKMREFEWLLEKSDKQKLIGNKSRPYYGDITELNKDGSILCCVGKKMLELLANDIMELIDTSLQVFEKDGKSAYSVSYSQWCLLLDESSRKLCHTDDNTEALRSGKWLCHECCWNDSALTAIKSGRSTDTTCTGGIRLYAEPIFAGDEIIGAINIGYGNPPESKAEIEKISELFNVSENRLMDAAVTYKSRPPFIIEQSKKRLKITAEIIGKIVYQEKVENRMRKTLRELEIFNEASVNRELLINDLRKEVNKFLVEMDKPPKYEII